MRGYYGTFSHNAKAVYQRYLGWYDANPANLNPLPPVERAKKTVAYMGGAAAAIARAREDFAKGEYRWVADAMSQVVFAEPDNSGGTRARRRRAGAAGLPVGVGHLAQRLSAGCPRAARRHVACRPIPSRAMPDIVRGLSLDLFFDFLGVRLNGAKAEGKTIVVNWEFADTAQRYALTLQNCALTYLADRHAEAADATVTLDRADAQPHHPARAGAAGGGGGWIGQDRRRRRARSPSCSPCSTISPSPSRWSSRCGKVNREEREAKAFDRSPGLRGSRDCAAVHALKC